MIWHPRPRRRNTQDPAKTIVNPEGDTGNRDQNAYFYEAAESLLASVILLLAEFLPPRDGKERRHIVSVFKLIQIFWSPPL